MPQLRDPRYAPASTNFFLSNSFKILILIRRHFNQTLAKYFLVKTIWAMQ